MTLADQGIWIALLAVGGPVTAITGIVSAVLAYRSNTKAKEAETSTAEHAQSIAEKAAAVDGLEQALKGVLLVNAAHTSDITRQGLELADQRGEILELRIKLDDCERGRAADQSEYRGQIRELTARVRELEGVTHE